MYDYKDAKELKDEGFPQTVRPGTMVCKPNGEAFASKIFASDPAELELGDVVVIPGKKEWIEWSARDPEGGYWSAADRDEGGSSNHMTSELAEELAKARFHSGFYPSACFYYKKDNSGGAPYKVHIFSRYSCAAGEVVCAAPTLTDLIEACEEKLVEIRYNPETGKWGASDSLDWTQARHTGVGASPEEAVARLWLALKAAGTI